MSAPIEVILLCALPASGKSETRKFLRSLTQEDCLKTFKIGESVQLDDYPYVHMMRQVDTAAIEAGAPTIFFKALDQGFIHAEDWLTLMHLINEDFDDLTGKPTMPVTKSAAKWLFARMDTARTKAGLSDLICDSPAFATLCEKLEGEARSIMNEKFEGIPESLENKTVVIEFARGGNEGSSYPLPHPMGYQASLAALSDNILNKAAMLYVWVTPEMSRAKNNARAAESAGDPNTPGLSLNHGVPECVMRGDYGTDDIEFLMGKAAEEGVDSALLIEKAGVKKFVPIARFDNRPDHTTFCRGPRAEWPEDKVAGFRAELEAAFKNAIAAFEAVKAKQA